MPKIVVDCLRHMLHTEEKLFSFYWKLISKNKNQKKKIARMLYNLKTFYLFFPLSMNILKIIYYAYSTKWDAPVHYKMFCSIAMACFKDRNIVLNSKNGDNTAISNRILIIRKFSCHSLAWKGTTEKRPGHITDIVHNQSV